MDIEHEKEIEKEARAKGYKIRNCYEDHWLALIDGRHKGIKLSRIVPNIDELRLCHGTVRHPKAKIPRHGHAWLEANGLCIDLSTSKKIVLPQVIYYALGSVQDVNRYTLKEAAIWADKSGTYGPWE